MRRRRAIPWPWLTAVSVLAGLFVFAWWAPVRGQLMFVPEDQAATMIWPRLHLEPERPAPGQTVRITLTDRVPWAYVQLAVAGYTAQWVGQSQDVLAGTYSWTWSAVTPATPGWDVVLYRDCERGCVEQARYTLGDPAYTAIREPLIPTKLGVVFPDPDRDWHGRSGWVVEVAYTRRAEDSYWGINDLSDRVKDSIDDGQRVLIRVDYDQGQSLPPPNDYVALDDYLSYLRRLARDDRFRGVYGLIIGSGFNATSPDQPTISASWYARVFNGFGQPPARDDNVIDTLRGVNGQLRVLVGPVRPWVNDQAGAIPYVIDQPWLNYMNTLVAAIDAATQEAALAGFADAGPDGFALQAPGRPSAPELGQIAPADEPRTPLPRAAWGGAQAGFQVYRDWVAIINTYRHTRGMPVFITSTNTFAPDEGVPPAENYPRGWLSAAYEVVNADPQVQALIWFADTSPTDNQWRFFTLTPPSGLMVDAADEFDQLLMR